MSSDLAAALRKELEQVSYMGKFNKGDFWMRCPFHSNGQEKTPSLIINLTEGSKFPIGSCHCFSCGFYSNDWNEVAKKVGLKQFNLKAFRADTVSSVFTLEDESKLFGKKTVRSKCSIDWPKTDEWRGIKGTMLAKLKAKLFYSDVISDNQLYLPVSVMGEEIGGINCMIKRRDKSMKGYFNEPGEWSLKALFPFDFVKRNNEGVVALVEGPRDSLNLNQHGFPALAVIGTGTLMGKNQKGLKRKCNLLLSLNPSLVVLMFDPDGAGRRASNAAFNYLKDKVNVKTLILKDGKDPADLKEDEVTKIYSFFRKSVKKLA